MPQPEDKTEKTRRRMPRRVKVALIVAVCYGILWAVTATWGVADTTSYVLTIMEGNLNKTSPGSRRLGFDPWEVEHEVEIPAAWHFVGNGASWFPFLVGVDWGGEIAPTYGSGARTYFLWFFGINVQLFDIVQWNS